MQRVSVQAMSVSDCVVVFAAAAQRDECGCGRNGWSVSKTNQCECE